MISIFTDLNPLMFLIVALVSFASCIFVVCQHLYDGATVTENYYVSYLKSKNNHKYPIHVSFCNWVSCMRLC